jgi:transposase
VELREIRNEEGNRLPRIVRRESGSVLTWRRAQVLVLAAQRMPPARIAELVFSDPDTVRELLPNFNREGFDALYPRYRGGRARRFRLPERQQIKRVALRVPSDLGQPFATWSLAKLADYLVAEEVLADSSHAGLRAYPGRARASVAFRAFLNAISPLASWRRARWLQSFFDQRMRIPRLRLSQEWVASTTQRRARHPGRWSLSAISSPRARMCGVNSYSTARSLLSVLS